MKIINWFDIFVLVLLVVGIFHGRKRGMSLELLPLLKLLVIIVLGSQIYLPISGKITEWTNGTMSGALSAVCSYVLFALLVHMVFTRIKTAVGEKLVGSDLFGGMEYYFGMLAGMLRFACYILIGMAILNAKPINYDKEKSYRKTEKDNLGNITFPTYTSVQIDVFERSQVGKVSKLHVNHLLIKPNGEPSKKTEPIARRREQAIEELMSNTNSKPAPPKAQ